jgi:hypothetical protein
LELIAAKSPRLLIRIDGAWYNIKSTTMETTINQELPPEKNGQQYKTAYTEVLDTPVNSKPTSVTNTMVSKNEEVSQPVKQETKSLDSLSLNNQRIDDHYNHLIDKNWGIMERWRNPKMYELVQKEKENLFNATSSYRLGFYKTMLDTRLAALHEKCSAGISMIKGHYRQRTSSFLMSKMEELSFEVRDRQFNWLESMKTKYDYAKTLEAYPTMQQRYMESIFQEEGRMLSFLDSLLIKFENIVNEELQKYN